MKPNVIFSIPEVTKVTHDSISIKWNCEVEGVPKDSVKFEVFVKGDLPDGSPFDRIEAPERNSCTITRLKQKTTYSLYVVAVHEGEDLAQSPDTDDGLVVKTLKKIPPIDWKKIAIIAGSALAGIALIALLIGLLKPKTPVEIPEKRVYSCAYDGFVYIHDGPSYSNQNIGKFKNGPEGAILLEDLGDWTKIDDHGIIGYVASKHVQDTPTIAYTGDVDVDWLEGVWQISGYDKLEIYNNGVFRSLPGCEVGKWILQNNEIKFTMVYREDNGEDDEDEDDSVFEMTLPINRSPDSLGEFHRQRFMSQQEFDLYKAPGTYTLAGFRETGKNLLRVLEGYLPKK